MLKQYSGNIPLTACVLSRSIWFHLLLGTGYWHRWTFGLTWSSFSGAFVAFFFFPCYKSRNAASSASLISESCQLTCYSSKLRREGHANRLCPSSPAFQIWRAAPRNCKASWFNLPGICWERGEYWGSNSATFPNAGGGWNRFQMPVVLYWCRRSSTQSYAQGWRRAWDWDLSREDEFHSEKPWQLGCCTSSGKDLGDYGCGLQKLTDSGIKSPFISVRSRVKSNPQGTSWNSTKSTSKRFLNNPRQRISAVKCFNTLSVN